MDERQQGWRLQQLRGPRRWVASGAALVTLAAMYWCAVNMSADKTPTQQQTPLFAGDVDPVAALAIPRGWQPSADRLQALQRTEIISQALRFIRRRYVEPERVSPRQMFVAAVESISHRVDGLMVEHPSEEVLTLAVNDQRLRVDLTRITDLARLDRTLHRAVNFCARQLPGPSLRGHIEYAAINGLLDTLDPYSAMLDPEAWHEMKTHTGGQFGGLGIRILIRAGVLTLDSVLPNSPASRARLRAKDKILQIDGEDTLNMSVDDAVDRLRGKVGSSVLLLIARASWPKPKRVRLTRAVIRLQSVEGRMIRSGIAYARIKNFQRGTSKELAHLLRGLRPPSGFRGVILDLRGNPGGLLDEAVKVCDLWLEGGPVVITVAGGRNEREVRSAMPSSDWSDVPLVVLISKRSASASEIVAGALRESNRAVLMGERSWGKGTVQVPFEIGEGALKLTVAKYLLPGDVCIQDTGVTPDIALQFITANRQYVRLYAPNSRVKRRPAWANKRQTQRRRSVHHMRLLLPEGESSSSFRELAPTTRAAELLLNAGEVQTSRFLSRALDWLQRRATDDEEELIGRLKAAQIDWRTGPRPKTLALKIAAAKPRNLRTVRAGETIPVRLVVRNEGKEPVYRVHVLSKSASPALDGMEQLIGMMKPGQSREVMMRMRPSRRHLSVTLPVHFVVAVDGRSTEQRATQNFKVLQLPRPHFRWRLSWAGRPPAEGGLGPNQRAQVKLEVRNDGVGWSRKTRANLRSLAGRVLHVEHGRVDLGAIAPGQTRSATFTVKIQPNIKQRRPGLLAMRLEVKDVRLGVRRREKVYLPWLGELGAEKMRERAKRNSDIDRWRNAPKIRVSSAHEDGAACSVKLSGEVDFSEGSGGKGSVTVSTDGSKRAYIDAKGNSIVPLDLSLPLDKRLNRITIRARIGRRQLQRRDLLVFCSGAPQQ